MVEYSIKVAIVSGLALSAVAVAGIAIANRMCDNAARVGTASGLALQYPGYYDISQNKCCVATAEFFGEPIYECVD